MMLLLSEAKRYISTKTEYSNAIGSLGFPDSSDGRESAYNSGNPSSSPGSGRSPGEGIGNPPVLLGLPYGLRW